MIRAGGRSASRGAARWAPRLLAPSLLAAAACTGVIGQAEGVEAGDESGGEENSGDTGSLPPPAPCEAGELCPDGFQCRTGLCLPQCEAGDPCPEGHYCDDAAGLCRPEQVATCPCDAPQFCSLGACASRPRPEDCDESSLLDGVCAPHELCIAQTPFDDDPSTHCYEMPACAADGSCPKGIYGSVCNDGLLLGKDRICLIGHCLAATDCPESFSCVDTGHIVGVCSSGTIGDICTVHAHCNSGQCIVPLPGLPGFCG